ncbi:MAG: thiamine pyrophosphate-binding protein [Rhodospirillales bacterium]|nr:thiamine pyrophosphate-binding protein [Rhodospirillales bacterium]
MSEAPSPNVAKAIVSALEQYGVDTIFGLPGVQMDPLYEAFYHARNSIRIMQTRHEQTTAYMANGYALSTGRLGVCTVVPGPGLLNASAALATGYAANAPVLCITGQIPSHAIGKRMGMLHEIGNQMAGVSGFTKWQGSIMAPEDVGPVLSRAISEATSGRNGPVVVEVPPDVLNMDWDGTLHDFDPAPVEQMPDADAVARAAEALAAATHPVICAGSGTMEATAELRALAELLSAPIIVSQYGQGIADCRDPLTHSLASGIKLWPSADVALAVGTRLATQAQFWGFDDDIKLVRIDADDQVAKEPWPADIHLTTTSKLGLQAIIDALSGADTKGEWDQDALAKMKAETEAGFKTSSAMHYDYTKVIRDALPDDGYICIGLTQLGYYAAWGFPVYNPRTFVRGGYQGTLGFGFPTALGAKVAHPDVPVICVAGDGGLMFDIQELSSAVLHNINLITVVFNDAGYGNVRRNQKLMYNEHYIASDLHNPDFVALAEAFGAVGMRAEGPEGLSAALKEAIGLDKPVLIEVPVGEFPPWQPISPRQKVRGA